MIPNKQTTEAVQFESRCSNRGQFGVGLNLPLIAFSIYRDVAKKATQNHLLLLPYSMIFDTILTPFDDFEECEDFPVRTRNGKFEGKYLRPPVKCATELRHVPKRNIYSAVIRVLATIGNNLATIVSITLFKSSSILSNKHPRFSSHKFNSINHNQQRRSK